MKHLSKPNPNLASSAINVLLIEPQALVSSALVELLKPFQQIKIVGRAANGEQALQLARHLNPDIVLIELNIPKISGLELAQRILKINLNFKMIALTEHTEEPYPSRFIQLGGLGYLTKNCSLEELKKAILAVDKGEAYLTPTIAQKLAISQVMGKNQSPLEQLSERELQVFLMISQGSQVNQIAEKLYLSPKTVNTYRYRLFDKLGIDNNVDLTHLALRYGLLSIANTAV